MAQKIIQTPVGEIGWSYVPQDTGAITPQTTSTQMPPQTITDTNTGGLTLAQMQENYKKAGGTLLPNGQIDFSKPIVASKMNQQGVNIGSDTNNTNYNDIIKSGNAGLAAGTPPPPPTETTETKTEPTRLEKLYQSLVGKTEDTTDTSAEQRYLEAEKQSGILNTQKELQDVNAQLAALSAEAESYKLAQEGRLASFGAISGQQRDIDRQLAQKALPLQARAAALQGNMEFAQNRLGTLFKLQTEDIKNKYERNKDLREKAYLLASAEEKRILDQQQIEDDRAYQTQTAFLKSKDDYVKAAVENGQGSLAVKIADAKNTDDLYNLAGQITANKTGIFNGLTPGQASMFNTMAQAYRKSPLIAAANRTITLQNSIDDVLKDPNNGAYQLSLVYAYVQALDTYQSAVREGELSLVQSIDSKAGQLSNYVQQITSGQIVRAEVIKQIAEASQSLKDTISSGAKRAEQDFASQANVVGLDRQWNQYISGFTKSYDDTKEQQQVSNTTASGKTWTVEYTSPLKSGYSGVTSSGINFSVE